MQTYVTIDNVCCRRHTYTIIFIKKSHFPRGYNCGVFMGTHMKWKANIMYWPIFGLFVFYDINQFDPQVPICRWLLGSTEIFVGFVTMLQCNIGSDYLIPSSLFFPATCLLLNCSHEPPDHPPSNTGVFFVFFCCCSLSSPAKIVNST